MSGSLKRRLAGRNAKAIDQVLGEQVELLFKHNGTNDPDRPKEIISAVLRQGDVSRESIGGGRTREWNGTIADQSAQLTIDRNKYKHLTIRVDDMVRALEDPRAPLFTVIDIEHRTARWVLKLKANK